MFAQAHGSYSIEGIGQTGANVYRSGTRLPNANISHENPSVLSIRGNPVLMRPSADDRGIQLMSAPILEPPTSLNPNLMQLDEYYLRCQQHPRASTLYQSHPAFKPRPMPPTTVQSSVRPSSSAAPATSGYPQQQMRNYREEMRPSASGRSMYQKRVAVEPMTSYEESWNDANVDFESDHGRWANDGYECSSRYLRNATIDDEPYVDEETFLNEEEPAYRSHDVNRNAISSRPKQAKWERRSGAGKSANEERKKVENEERRKAENEGWRSQKSQKLKANARNRGEDRGNQSWKPKVTLQTDIHGMKHWSVYRNEYELLFEVCAKVDSGVTNSQWRGMKHFCIRDENDTESVRYAETDQHLPELNVGDWVRCGLLQRSWGCQAFKVEKIPEPDRFQWRKKIQESAARMRQRVEDASQGVQKV